MTCIAAIQTPEGIFIGCDSQCTTGWTKSVIPGTHPKLFVKNGILFGVAGSAGEAQAIQYRADFAKYHADDDPDGYVATAVLDGIQQALRNANILHVENSVAETGLNLIVDFKNKLYYLSNRLSFLSPYRDFISCGSGEHVALGSLHTTAGAIPSPAKRLELALTAACDIADGCGGPVHVYRFSDGQLVEMDSRTKMMAA